MRVLPHATDCVDEKLADESLRVDWFDADFRVDIEFSDVLRPLDGAEAQFTRG